MRNSKKEPIRAMVYVQKLGRRLNFTVGEFAMAEDLNTTGGDVFGFEGFTEVESDENSDTKPAADDLRSAFE